MGILRPIRLAMKALLPRSTYRAVCRRYALLHQDRALRSKIIAYLERSTDDDEKRAVLDYLRVEPLAMIPYAFTSRYDHEDIEVETDGDMCFVMHRGKRLYFPTTDREQAASAYCGLLTEQDPASPHSYCAEPECMPEPGDVIADIGAAEGIWALDNIENVTRGAYLFESEEPWIAALKKTFEPWRDKVTIVNRYVGDSDDDAQGYVTLDTFFADKRIDCIKADIEGAELSMLRGGRRTLAEKIHRAIICAYHRQDDERDIRAALAEAGYSKVSATGGYLLLWADPDLSEPYLRRGVVYGMR